MKSMVGGGAQGGQMARKLFFPLMFEMNFVKILLLGDVYIYIVERMGDSRTVQSDVLSPCRWEWRVKRYLIWSHQSRNSMAMQCVCWGVKVLGGKLGAIG